MATLLAGLREKSASASSGLGVVSSDDDDDAPPVAALPVGEQPVASMDSLLAGLRAKSASGAAAKAISSSDDEDADGPPETFVRGGDMLVSSTGSAMDALFAQMGGGGGGDSSSDEEGGGGGAGGMDALFAGMLLAMPAEEAAAVRAKAAEMTVEEITATLSPPPLEVLAHVMAELGDERRGNGGSKRPTAEAVEETASWLAAALKRLRPFACLPDRRLYNLVGSCTRRRLAGAEVLRAMGPYTANGPRCHSRI